MSSITAGKLLLSFVAVATGVGAFIADFNETHVYNPRWPPHAKFHNGQTMSMAVALGIFSLYYTWRSGSLITALASKMAIATARENVQVAALAGAVYYVTGVTAILYPGSEGYDPEFGTGFPQWKLYVPLLGLILLGRIWR